MNYPQAAIADLGARNTHFRSLVQAVSEGLVKGWRSVHVPGWSPSVASGVLEDIWDAGTTWIPDPAALVIPARMKLQSSESADASGGTGVSEVEIHGLDGDFAEQKETVAVLGDTPASLTLSYRRFNAMHTMAVGSNFVSEGDIILTDTGASIEYIRISANGNMSLSCHYTIPAGHVGYVVSWAASSATAKSVRFILRATCDWETRELLDGIYLFQDVIAGTSDSQHVFANPPQLPALCDVKVSGNPVTGGDSDATASMQIIHGPAASLR